MFLFACFESGVVGLGSPRLYALYNTRFLPDLALHSASVVGTHSFLYNYFNVIHVSGTFIYSSLILTYHVPRIFGLVGLDS